MINHNPDVVRVLPQCISGLVSQPSCRFYRGSVRIPWYLRMDDAVAVLGVGHLPFVSRPTHNSLAGTICYAHSPEIVKYMSP